MTAKIYTGLTLTIKKINNTFDDNKCLITNLTKVIVAYTHLRVFIAHFPRNYILSQRARFATRLFALC